MLKPGGRLVVVTFHSLEDGIVKRFLKGRAEAARQGSRHLPPGAAPGLAAKLPLHNPRPTTAGEAEPDANPRARSAKLRCGTPHRRAGLAGDNWIRRFRACESRGVPFDARTGAQDQPSVPCARDEAPR